MRVQGLMLSSLVAGALMASSASASPGRPQLVERQSPIIRDLKVGVLNRVDSERGLETRDFNIERTSTTTASATRPQLIERQSPVIADLKTGVKNRIDSERGLETRDFHLDRVQQGSGAASRPNLIDRGNPLMGMVKTSITMRLEGSTDGDDVKTPQLPRADKGSRIEKDSTPSSKLPKTAKDRKMFCVLTGVCIAGGGASDMEDKTE
jgi:hypothetical protein